MLPPSRDWKEGQILLDDFVVERLLGQGGMGKVYLMRSIATARRFAVKQAHLRSDSDRKAFLAELQTWIDLPLHPHILPCRFFRTVASEILIFTDFAKGGSLADWITEAKFRSPRRKLDVAIQFASGLCAIHEHGLIHQDVKPANVLMSGDGIAQVADFGLARALVKVGIDGDTSVRIGGDMLVSAAGMTPAYASPEQRAGKRLSPKTDIWSWALSIMDLFLGRVSCPYGGHIAREVLLEASDPASPDADLLPSDLVRVLLKCFESEPEKRWESLGQIVSALKDIHLAYFGPHSNRASIPQKQEQSHGVSTPSHSRYDFTPKEWMEHMARITGDPQWEATGIARSVQGSLVESIRVMEQVTDTLGQLLCSHDLESARQYFSAAYVLADLYRRLSDSQGCFTTFQGAISALEQLTPQSPEILSIVAEARRRYADALRDGRFLDQARLQIQKALRLFDLIQDPTPFAREVVECLTSDGTILSELGLLKEAEEAFHKVIELLNTGFIQDHAALGFVLNNLALVERRSGKIDAAVSHYEQCIKVRQDYLAEHEESLDAVDDLAGTFNNLSTALFELGRPNEALKAVERSISYRKELLERYNEPNLVVSLAKARINRAAILLLSKEKAAAIREYDQALQLFLPLIELQGRVDLLPLARQISAERDKALRTLNERQ